jgi:hypothetical protein
VRCRNGFIPSVATLDAIPFVMRAPAALSIFVQKPVEMEKVIDIDFLNNTETFCN